MTDLLRIQELVQEHFEHTDHELFIEITDTFVYEKATTNPKVSDEIKKFLDAMDINVTYANYLAEKRRKDKGYFSF